MTDKLKMRSMDKVQDNIGKIREMFPNAVTEVIDGYYKDLKGEDKPIIKLKVDFDVLKQELADTLIDERELRYQLTWPDKQRSVLLANSSVEKTLRPDKERSVDFDGTRNLYLEGDNLDVLKLLRETYLHSIDVIYLDPPYNTGKNYIYKNDFSKKKGEFLFGDSQIDDERNRLVVNMQSNGRFHTDWLNMMYPRLKVAKDLLSPQGVLICAIDENEFSTLTLILKEIFSEGGYEFSYATVVHNPRGQQGLNFSYVNEYAIFIYPNDGGKYLGDMPKKEVDARGLRDSGTESDRVDARNCFYPFYVQNGAILSVGDVPDPSYHPQSANVVRADGVTEVWPMTDDGAEKKWRYARQSVGEILDKLTVKKGRNSLQIVYNKGDETMRSLWENPRYDASEYGTKTVQSLLGIQDGFSFPKSLWLIYDILKYTCPHKKNVTVLDFFSGSATTAHAVMQLNDEDGGDRKFIMVQLPEPCDEKSEAYKAGYKTICDIGEERIRRAGKKIKEEMQKPKQQGIDQEDPSASPRSARNDAVAQLDVGFRVLRLDSSNMREVYYHPGQYTQTLLDGLADNIKGDRTPLDLLFQVMLDLGVEPSAKIEEKEIAGKQVFAVNENELIACFDSGITDEVVKAIAQRKPRYAAFRDNAYAYDSVADNFEQIFATYSPNTKKEVL